MKNIHLIPTDKPSRLYTLNSSKKLYYTNNNLNQIKFTVNQNIYITSDEEIKEGDWFIWKDTEEPYIFKCIGLTDTDSLQVENSLTRKIGTFHRNPKDSDYGDWYRCYSKKIILTTDNDLIKDGVQAIDDEFLEWFVNNPSCEGVDIMTDSYTMQQIYQLKLRPDIFKYKIIIPKEEQKQHLIDMMKTDEELGLYEEHKQTDEKGKPMTYWGGLEKPKQKTTPEEVAEYLGFVKGAKWQQEQDKNKYSEEEVLQLLLKMNEWPTTFDGEEDIKEWFKQFKNKLYNITK